MRRIHKYLSIQMFYPSLVGLFVNPFFIARRGLVKAIANLSPNLTGSLLDIGCGRKPYEKLFHVDQYIGLDIDSERTRAEAKADFLYDGDKFPFPDNSFNSVLCNQVLEHVFNPDEFIKEIRRVCKPDGAILLTVPFLWDEHEQPFDYARYTSFGLKALLEKNGLKIEIHQKINPNLSAIFQLINCYLYKILPENLYVRLITCAIIMAPISLLGIILGKLLPNNQDLYLDQIIIAKKINK